MNEEIIKKQKNIKIYSIGPNTSKISDLLAQEFKNL